MKKMVIILLTVVFLPSACSKGKNPVTPGNGEYILAGHNKAKVDSLMHLINAIAGLTDISSDDVRSAGTSREWTYLYMVSSDTIYYCHTDLWGAVYDSCTYGFFVGGAVITHGWFDSDRALQIAEQNGGRDFRTEHPDYRIDASLYEPVIPNTSTYWYIEYKTQTDNNDFGIIINAVTGEIRYPG